MKSIVIFSASLLMALSGALSAQNFPTRPITLVVPAPAGGPTDIIGRQAAQVLGTQISQNVIVENRGGAGNTIACVPSGVKDCG